MIGEFHFIRPLWLLAVLVLFACVWLLRRQTPAMGAWRDVCDAHLLPHLMCTKTNHKRRHALRLLYLSALCMIVSAAGPAWTRLPVPVYKTLQPRVVVLDMSERMSNNDVSPDRLTRAKFKLHDLLKKQNTGQFGLVVYSGEPFIVSPLTDDGQTIDALLASLTLDVMPVSGNRLDLALQEAGKLLRQAGYRYGEVLVMTGESPTAAAVDAAKALAGAGFHVSVMPLISDNAPDTPFQPLAESGHGMLIPFADNSADIDRWLAMRTASHFNISQQDDFPIWKDEGRWFLIPALLCLLPVFRRGWLQRIST